MVSPGFFDDDLDPAARGPRFHGCRQHAEPSVAIVNESFVRKFDLGSDAVGTTLRLNGRYVPQGAVEIIGVVADAKYSTIKDDVPPQFFTPRPPLDTQFVALFFYVRAAIDAAALVRRFRSRGAHRSERSREQSDDAARARSTATRFSTA